MDIELLGWKADQPGNIDEMESDSHVVAVQVTTWCTHILAEDVHFDGKLKDFAVQPRKNCKKDIPPGVLRLINCLLHFKI